ncbi:MAG: hypothetical protein ACJAT6_000865 [Akkermansiaceae bacterium]
MTGQKGHFYFVNRQAGKLGRIVILGIDGEEILETLEEWNWGT